MKLKLFLSPLLFLVISFNVCAQTIYHFEYSFPNANDTNKYDAFLVQNDDGSGFVRIKYETPGGLEPQLVEMYLQSQYFSVNAGNIDTNKIYYKATDPNFIIGNSQSKFTPPVFWYTKNPASGLFDPSAVSSSAEDDVKTAGELSKKDYLKSDDIKKNFVLQFFTAQEDFYQNLFGLRSRGLSSTEKNIHMYLLVVANTNDSAIGNSCYKDMNRMVETFKDLADYLDIGDKFVPMTIYGKAYNKKNIEEAIKNLKPSSPNDIIIFYYSGHGFRKTNDKRRYPYLDFRATPKDDYNVQSMNVEDIFKAISKKDARFKLVLSDCCNTEPESVNSVGTPIPKPRGSGFDWSEDNIRSLFLSPKKMTIFATAADIGQKASSNNDFGGFFSYYFKTAMENHFSVFKKNVTWDQVMQDAEQQTAFKAQHTYCEKPYIPQNICKQLPFYKVLSIE